MTTKPGDDWIWESEYRREFVWRLPSHPVHRSNHVSAGTQTTSIPTRDVAVSVSPSDLEAELAFGNDESIQKSPRSKGPRSDLTHDRTLGFQEQLKQHEKTRLWDNTPATETLVPRSPSPAKKPSIFIIDESQRRPPEDVDMHDVEDTRQVHPEISKHNGVTGRLTRRLRLPTDA
ncbi:hypothetical protein M427DRAFT_53545 [Gonapodya prolifera JEL478]|uniref:Uncharacterized protein n=1 Tax=Gonapodya prolifera (strain JEL478) TaxID=1344416 RepID=A0A139APE1_GONPJ|nr:hypothetical protein M427DRAFT_53545 [Gonapodya prolifera JEL478]|eukprot:KXS18592.1 hypothetical protein M427DRAFT_53545 [Gonapodya prolifera JEL478]